MRRWTVATLMLVALASGAQEPAVDLARWVDPFIGTGGHGHSFPGPALPFGMVQVGPDTRLSGWDGTSGYHDDDTFVHGFSHTHLSGTGIADYCDVLLLPSSRPVEQGAGSRFLKESEAAEPGYYRVRLEARLAPRGPGAARSRSTSTRPSSPATCAWSRARASSAPRGTRAPASPPGSSSTRSRATRPQHSNEPDPGH